MKVHMKTITKELLQKELNGDLDQTYRRIKAVEPEDSLEKYRISVAEFDQLLREYGSDPQIKEGLRKMMGVHNSVAEKEQVIPLEKVIDVHAYMLKELSDLVGSFEVLKKDVPQDHYDRKTVTLAVQAIMDARVEEKFSVKSEDIEQAVIRHHCKLATDQKFANISQEMHGRMEKLVGA
jgi:hypothetical protein